jgi:hypothetical protein
MLEGEAFLADSCWFLGFDVKKKEFMCCPFLEAAVLSAAKKPSLEIYLLRRYC